MALKQVRKFYSVKDAVKEKDRYSNVSSMLDGTYSDMPRGRSPDILVSLAGTSGMD